MTAFPRRTVLALTATLLLTCAAPALATGDDPVLRRMDAVLEENTRLREDAWKARKHGKDAARQASDAFEASEVRLEKSRTEALAHVAGISPTQVEAMRKEGKSWGQVAGEVGVHPGFLGIGKVPMYEPPQVRKAMAKQAKQDKALKGKRGVKGKTEGKLEGKAEGKSAGAAVSAKGKKSSAKTKQATAKSTKAPTKTKTKAKAKATKN